MPLITPIDDETDKPDEKQTDREGNLYNNLVKMKDIPVADGYVTFTWSLRYLGSLILFDLQDDRDIAARIATVSTSMGALKDVWRNPHLDMYNKYLLFRTIPMNLSLWGCKTWSL